MKNKIKVLGLVLLAVISIISFNSTAVSADAWDIPMPMPDLPTPS